MKLTLKKDENGTPVFEDDKPVYVTDDGKDFVADVPSLYNKTLEVKGEAKRYRERAETAEGQVTAFKTLFPDMDTNELATWKGEADSAITTVKNFNDKQLVDAGRVEEIKKELQDAHTKNLEKVNQKYDLKLTANEQSIKKKDNQIFALKVGSQFSRSPWFTGEDRKTTMLPDAAESLFGKNFKVNEDPTTGELVVVGYYNGKEILSSEPERVGEIASFDEAIEYIIDRYPNKQLIMRTGPAGSGAGGGTGGGAGGDTDVDKLSALYKKALDSGDGRQAVVLKRRLYEAQQASVRR